MLGYNVFNSGGDVIILEVCLEKLEYIFEEGLVVNEVILNLELVVEVWCGDIIYVGIYKSSV